MEIIIMIIGAVMIWLAFAFAVVKTINNKLK